MSPMPDEDRGSPGQLVLSLAGGVWRPAKHKGDQGAVTGRFQTQNLQPKGSRATWKAINLRSSGLV